MMNGKKWILEVITLNGISFGNAIWTAVIGNLSILLVILQIILILLTVSYTGIKFYDYLKKRKKNK